MPITKASGNSVTAAAKGDLVVGNATNDSGVLTVGANNTVLTADSTAATGLKWAAAAGSNDDFTLLNAGGTALTGATTITISFSAKNKLFVYVDGASSANASSSMRIRFNSDTTTKYTALGYSQTATSAGTQITLAAQSEFELATMGASAGNYVEMFFTLEGAGSTGVKVFDGISYASGSTTNVNRIIKGQYTGTSAITSISIISSTGNLDNGTIYVYGA